MNPRTTLHTRRGVALVIVLVMLVLMSGIVIGFLSMANTERASATSQAGGLAARQLGESAVNLVITQIRDATTAADTGGTWASQPGAIRTYAPNGQGDKVFKLYSADELRVDATNFNPAADAGDLATLDTNPFDIPDGWADMNAPALAREYDSNGRPVTIPRYPILDPSVARPMGDRTAPNSPGIVEGFECAQIAIDDPDDGPKIPVLPMPVRWLYVLRDGAIAKATDATLDNPIVGRIAFWTDDESSKVNINTASEGTFWDTPSYSSRVEAGQISSAGALQSQFDSLNLAVSQPVRNEFQRYPGHPATTSLSPVLGWLWPEDPYATRERYANFKEAIYQLAPYVRHYDASRAPTSRSGTAIGVLTANYGAVTSNRTIPLDKTRLFATVDEYMFRPNRTPWDSNDTASSDQRLPQTFPNMTPDALEKVRFFLTAHSRSPELNLWSKPRVTIWPIEQNRQRRTQFDALFAFCSTVAGREFFITRTQDGHRSPTDDFTRNPRNREVYDYLRSLLNQPVPGWGSRFSTKFGADTNQILTQIFDYVRCVNLVDTSTPTTGGDSVAPYTPRFWTGAPGSSRPNDNSGQVTPLRIDVDGDETQGLGRFPTISEVAVLCTPLTQNPPQMRIILAFEMFVANPGFPAIKETYTLKVTRLEDIRVLNQSGASTPANFPRVAFNVVNLDGSHEPLGRAYMPNRGWANGFWFFRPGTTRSIAAKTLTKANVGTPRLQDYTLFSDNIPHSGSRFFLEGGHFQVEVFADQNASTVPVHTYDFKLFDHRTPSGDGFPWPTWTKAFQNRITELGAGENAHQNHDLGWIRGAGATDGDIIRSFEYVGPGNALDNKGDHRHAVTSRRIIPASHFAPRGGASFNNPTILRLHGLKTCNGNRYPGHTPPGAEGRLSPGAPIRQDRHQKIPNGINGVKRADGGWGDWDRGISKTVDGAFGGRVDEGNAYFDLGSTSESYRMPYYHGARFIDPGQTYFSPNRMLSSPVMFGSLPTGVKRGLPWQTLLFRPDRPAPGEPSHPGAGSLPDHLLLDLFHMPVVEPYAISEPFSTAGKINLNYEIAPWGYARIDSEPWVRRDTGLRAVMKAVRVMAVPGTAAEAAHQEHALDNRNSFRHDIDLQKTLDAVQVMLDRGKPGVVEQNGIFRSASQICEIDLFPGGDRVDPRSPSPPSMGTSASDIGQFWYNHRLTGDNQRERPYSHIFPRVTTRSNVYNVHVRAQSIRIKPQAFGPNGELAGGELKESDVQVQSEYRGSSIIERFLDPNDKALQGYNENAPGREGSLEPYYRFRVIATKRFSE
jgi:uncharacterized protein (TIGR02600 family)